MELASGSGTFVKAFSFLMKLYFNVGVEPTDPEQVMVERERCLMKSGAARGSQLTPCLSIEATQN